MIYKNSFQTIGNKHAFSTYPPNSVNFAKAETFVPQPKYFTVPKITGSIMTLGVQFSFFNEIFSIGENGVFDSNGLPVGDLTPGMHEFRRFSKGHSNCANLVRLSYEERSLKEVIYKVQ